MKQRVQTTERFGTLGGSGIRTQQRVEVDAGETCNKVRKADETTHHAVTVKSVCKIGMPRSADDVALVPIGARIGVEQGPQAFAIQLRISRRCRLAEELPEVGI